MNLRQKSPVTAKDLAIDSSSCSERAPVSVAGWIGAGVLAAVLLWSYASAIVVLVERWWNDPDYLHGFLVPVFAAYLLWHRRGLMPRGVGQGSRWGLGLILVAAMMRLAAAYYYYALLDSLSLIPCLAGLALLIGGWRGIRWAWPSIVILVFMVPLPGFVANLLSHPLQRIGTITSTYLLQTLGIPAVAQGNVIVLTDVQLGVVEACNGLRMMVLFLAVCVGTAFVVDRPPLDRLILLLSAAPIALAANVFRITLTGILHETVSHRVADALFHDFAGWLMMPTAVLLLWAEVALLSRLLLPAPAAGPLLLKTPASSPGGRTKRGRERSRRPKRP